MSQIMDYEMWSRGADVYTSQVYSPPAPPMLPQGSGGTPGDNGPRRRIPKFLLAAIAGVVLIGAGLGAGRIMWGSNDTAPAPTAAPETTAPAAPDPNVLTPTQAKQQACDGYATLAAQWAAGYHDWYAAVLTVGEGWTWSNPTVKAAADKFFPAQSQIANSLRQLITPQTPQDVAVAINNYASAILSYAATQNTNTPSSEMDSRKNRVNSAVDATDKVCGL